MSINKIFLLAGLSVLALSAIGCEKKEEVKTVEWFMAPENKAVLDETHKQCNNNPGMLKDNPNCINAANAIHQLWTR